MAKKIKKKTLFLFGLIGLSLMNLFGMFSKERSSSFSEKELETFFINKASADVPYSTYYVPGDSGGPECPSSDGPSPGPCGEGPHPD